MVESDKLRLPKILTVGLVCFSLSDMSISNNNYDNNNIIQLVRPANAEFRAAQKRTFFRFTPKLIAGSKFFGTDLKTAIEKDDWGVVEGFFKEYVSKYNKNDPSQVDGTDSYINNNLLRPMKVLSGSFAERGSSPKQKLLAEKELAFEDAMKSLEGCIKDTKGEGFFASTIKMPTGKERTKQAIEAWKQGKVALNEYITALNDGLMLELNKLSTI